MALENELASASADTRSFFPKSLRRIHCIDRNAVEHIDLLIHERVTNRPCCDLVDKADIGYKMRMTSVFEKALRTDARPAGWTDGRKFRPNIRF